MILAIDTHSVLYLFDSLEDALKDLEGIDIENHEYEFCDDTGQGFSAVLTTPVTAFHSGTFNLVSSGEPDPGLLQSFLDRAREIGKPSQGISSFDDLRKWLSSS